MFHYERYLLFFLLQAEMDTLYYDVVAAEDKLAATLYSLRSNESLYADNILGMNDSHLFLM